MQQENIRKIKLSLLFATVLFLFPFNTVQAEEFIEDEYTQASNNVKESTPQLEKKIIPFTDKQLADIYYSRAIELMNNGEEVKAAEVFIKILEKHPAHIEARIKLIEVYRHIGWVEEAQSILDEGLRLDKENPKLLLHQATMQLEVQNPEKALSLLLKVKKDHHLDTDYKAVLAMTYHDLKLYDLARKNYNYLVRKDINNTKWWLGLAVTMDAQGDTKAALKSFKKVKELGGANADVLRYAQDRIAKLDSEDD